MKSEFPACLLTVILLLTSPASRAEEPLVLDELIVTAGLEPVSAYRVAGSVTVIDREEIEQVQARYLSDLLRTVPGFAVSQAGGPGAQTQVRVRGSEANHMLVLIDGVPANDAASADEFQFQYALTADIERIEIIRGPQSAIWGTDALSGVINIIRRKDGQQQARIDAETGSFGTRMLALDRSHTGDRIEFWAGLSKLESDGSNISRAGVEQDGSENMTLNAGLNFTPSPGIRLGLTGRYVDAESQFDDFDFLVTGLPQDADRLSISERTYLQAELSLRPASSAWSGSFAVNQTDFDNQNISDGSWTSSTAARTLEFKAMASLATGDHTTRRQRLSFALDRQAVDYSQRGLASFFGDPNQDQSYDVTGFAVEYSMTPTDRMDWTVSGRNDNFSAFDDVSTWQLGASYRLHESIRLRGALGTGAKAPGFTERFGFYEGSFAGNPELKPETSTGWEIGVDAWLKDGRYRLQVAYFDQDLQDEIDGFVFDPDSGLFTAENKQTTSSRSGYELSLDMEALEGLAVRVQYSHTRASEMDFDGLRMKEIRRPEQLASVSMHYRFPGSGADINLGIQFTGSQQDRFFSPQTFLSQNVKLPGFTVVNLAGSWPLSRSWEAVARVSNLLDQEYEEILGFARPGRAIYTGLRGRFNIR